MVEELIYKAELAENAERYEDMIKIMKEVVGNVTEVTAYQRNLLSIAYKNSINPKRTA